MAKDITELYASQNSQIIVGQNMTSVAGKTPDELVRRHIERRQKEVTEMEDAGYDYNGLEAWLQAMQNVGRR